MPTNNPLRKKLGEAQKKIKEVRDALNDATQDLRATGRDYTALDKKYGAQGKKLHSLQVKNKGLSTKAGDLQRNYTAKVAEYNTLKSQYDAKVGEAAHAVGEKSQLEKQVRDAEAALNTKAGEVAKAQQDLLAAQREADANRLKGDYDGKVKDLQIGQLQTANAQVNTECQVAQNKILDLDKKLEQAGLDLDAEKANGIQAASAHQVEVLKKDLEVAEAKANHGKDIAVVQKTHAEALRDKDIAYAQVEAGKSIQIAQKEADKQVLEAVKNADITVLTADKARAEQDRAELKAENDAYKADKESRNKLHKVFAYLGTGAAIIAIAASAYLMGRGTPAPQNTKPADGIERKVEDKTPKESSAPKADPVKPAYTAPVPVKPAETVAFAYHSIEALVDGNWYNLDSGLPSGKAATAYQVKVRNKSLGGEHTVTAPIDADAIDGYKTLVQEAQKYDLEFKRRTDSYKPDDYEKLVQKLPDIDETGAKGRITKEDVNKARNVVQGGLKAIVGE